MRLANLAHLLETCPRNRRNALAGLKSLGVAELDLRSKDCAGHVDPIVVGRPLEGLSRIDRPTKIFLALSIMIGCFVSHLLLQTLTLSFLLGLLLVGDLRRLHEIVLRKFNGAKGTFVMLRIESVAALVNRYWTQERTYQ